MAVLLVELDQSPLAGTSSWVTVPPWVLALVAATGVTLAALAMWPLIRLPHPVAGRTAAVELVPQTTAPLSGP